MVHTFIKISVLRVVPQALQYRMQAQTTAISVTLIVSLVSIQQQNAHLAILRFCCIKTSAVFHVQVHWFHKMEHVDHAISHVRLVQTIPITAPVVILVLLCRTYLITCVCRDALKHTTAILVLEYAVCVAAWLI